MIPLQFSSVQSLSRVRLFATPWWGHGAVLARLEDTPDSLGHTRSWAPPRLAPGAPSTPPPAASLQMGNLAQNTEIPGDWFRSVDPSRSREHLGHVLSVEEETLCGGPAPQTADPGVLRAAGAGTRWALSHTSLLCSLPSILHDQPPVETLGTKSLRSFPRLDQGTVLQCFHCCVTCSLIEGREHKEVYTWNPSDSPHDFSLMIWPG